MEILGIGPMELVFILIIALMVFGPERLPEIGAKMGKGLRSLRNATHEFSREIEETRQAIEAPLNEIKQPLSEITQPLKDLKQPFDELKQPFDELRQPFREFGQAAKDLPDQAHKALTLAAAGVNATVSTPILDGTQNGAEPMADAESAPVDHVEAATNGSEEAAESAPDAALNADDATLHTIRWPSDPAAERARLTPLALAVINPHEALREVIARQMRPEARSNS